MLTLEEAAKFIGCKVIYIHRDVPYLRPEEGVITSVNEHYVFVRYGADVGSKATRPEHLSLLAATS